MAKYYYCNRFVLLSFVALHTYSAVVPSKKEDVCWWTGCQPSTWAETGCDQYKRTETDRKECDGGSAYYCCPAAVVVVEKKPDAVCWWTGCQPNTWAVTGCDQYKRTETDRKECDGGSAYYCCPATSSAAAEKKPAADAEADCWWTGCQPDTWATKGCDSYNRTETDRKECDGGSEYKCCAQTVDDGATGADVGCPLCRSKIVDESKYARNCGKRVVGYYTSWGAKKIDGQALAKLTHVIYAFLEMRGDGTVDVGSPDIVHSADVEAETKQSRDRLEHLMDLAESFPHVKIMFAVGGWENSQYFSVVAESSEGRSAFADSVVKIIEKYGFDGIDVDWEYPVIGGVMDGVPQDKDNYVLLLKDLRRAFDDFAEAKDIGTKCGGEYSCQLYYLINGPSTICVDQFMNFLDIFFGLEEKLLISFAGAAGQWNLEPGFDLPGLLQYADFVNVMTYDFFGPWSSQWGAYTGPPAPLYFGMPHTFSGKTNVDWTIRYYACKTKTPHKINMGVPFYGRFWNNVGDPVDGNDQMWRKARAVNDTFQGGYTEWFRIYEDHLSDDRFVQEFHEKSKSPYAWNNATKVFLGYEDPRSLEFKVAYATEKNVGGLMIWSVDFDDEDFTLLNAVYNAPLCEKTDPDEINHRCSPINEKRWWSSEDGDDVAGLCGRSAPLYNGYYPVCDPDDPGYSCCGPFGYCGSGEKYCDCPTCKDYGKNPKLIVDEPIKPTVNVTWYFLNAKEGLRGRCGRTIPKINGEIPTCNPDDENAYCCSNGYYCGKGPDFCNCQGCVNYKRTTNKWWTKEDGAKRAATCGPKADKINGVQEAECEPNSKFNCCSPYGYCGTGPDYCDCKGCKRF